MVALSARRRRRRPGRGVEDGATRRALLAAEWQRALRSHLWHKTMTAHHSLLVCVYWNAVPLAAIYARNAAHYVDYPRLGSAAGTRPRATLFFQQSGASQTPSCVLRSTDRSTDTDQPTVGKNTAAIARSLCAAHSTRVHSNRPRESKKSTGVPAHLEYFEYLSRAHISRRSRGAEGAHPF
eukprot:SAG11_NODE_404_length_9736_cov_20.243022_13_plen_181_part_00